ncbi:glycoside hydrolase family 16 protein [Paludisphaera mucosa]|uniref:Glycoside hydrolase family 16 protein n=1 Tax=Paludisphaera mucosa TaxID=3030827 RepID=A0ABT6FD79_9BACT|nr:glycoside hydrolase family 16 protein [Paludisphaera mucosa]MDG3005525.1 glycoside hydrolase family 16 protein [Paludisphaera mucosa]
MLESRRWAWIMLGTLAILAGHGIAEESPKGWNLVWNDEFDGDAIDRTKWDFDLGDGFYDYGANVWIGGWGNDELQYYTAEPRNIFVRDGSIHIRALKESLQGRGYTSARVKTRARDGSALFAKAYGRFEFRAKLPTGRGIWPALWMLPQDDAHGKWPCSGEIDVMEARGQDPHRVSGTIHFGSPWPANVHAEETYAFPPGQSFADYHVYAVEWEPGEIRWFVDDRCFATKHSWWTSRKTGPDGRGVKAEAESDVAAWPAPFDKPFHIIMNVAVGGRFLGNPDPTTSFPGEMLVDYVRVYDKNGGYGSPSPRSDEALPWRR